MQPRAVPILTVLLSLLVPALLTGCGEKSAPPPPPAKRTLPSLPAIPAAERAAHALERLERGPGRLRGLQVAEVHRRNLELATADLVALEPEAAKLLEDPARIRRITGDAKRYGDAWHNVLRLLLGFSARPPELVIPWTEPALALPATPEYHALRVEAVRVLGLVAGDEAAELLLRFYNQAPADREIANMALVTLAARPAQRERAYDLALRQGTASLWENAPSRVAAGMPLGEVDLDIAGALAWWHALSAGSGPNMDTLLPKLRSQPWTQSRLATDPAVPPQVWAEDGSPRVRYGSIDATVMFGSGWFASTLVEGPELPAHAHVLTGKLPGGEARCLLASLTPDFAGYRHAVAADLALEAVDEGLYYAAKHCMLEADPVSDSETVERIHADLALGGMWDALRVRSLQRLVAALGIGSCKDARVWGVLERVLMTVRPLDVGRPVIEQAYDAMFRDRPEEVRELMRLLLRSEDAGARGAALHLVRRTRDAEFLDALEARLGETQDPLERRALRRTITFIYSAGHGVLPARYQAFVERYLGWLSEAEGESFAAQVSGLLDFGDAGIAAFVRGLEGPQRHLYVRGWPRGRRMVPQAVAEALIAPLDRHTPPAEMNHVLGLAWSSFPPSAAPALEDLRRRLPSARQGPVEAALERVRHRAPRHGDD